MSLRNGPLRASDESDACILFGLAPDGVYQAAEVTLSAGVLLPHRFTLTTHLPRQTVRRSILCCTFPSLTVGRRYRPSCPAEPGLSSNRDRQSLPRVSDRLALFSSAPE